MPSKQIHELPSANGLDPDDQFLLSTSADRLTRRASLANLPFRSPLPGTIVRRLSEKLGEIVSVRDFGAVGDGVADDAPAFKAAVLGHSSVHVPAGNFRLMSPVDVPPGVSVHGAGRFATIITAQGEMGFLLHRNAGSFRIDGAATDDWCRSSISDLTVRMTTGGIRAFGHEVRLQNLCFFGGSAPQGQSDANGWMIDLVDVNEALLFGIQGGYGGGSGHVLRANGVRWTTSRPGVNFGDSLAHEISIKLGAANTVAIMLEGNSTGLINNISFSRVQINAPTGGAAIAGTLPAFPGTTGIKLRAAARNTFSNIDVEVVETALDLEGLNANPGSFGCVTYNAFLNCYALNCGASDGTFDGTRVVKTNNAARQGAVMRNTFLGGQGFELLAPGGISSGDATVRSGYGDTFLPQSLWFSQPNDGTPCAVIRGANPGSGYSGQQLLFTTDYAPGSGEDQDGNPKKQKPRKGLRLDLSGVSSVGLIRSIGTNTDPNARIEIGNGPDPAASAGLDGPLRAVRVLDPIAGHDWPSEPVNPYTGSLFYTSQRAALPGTALWQGAGWYMRIDDKLDGATASAPSWTPVAGRQGIGRLREINTSAQVGRDDFGSMILANHGSSTITLTIPGNLLREEESNLGSASPHYRAGATFWVQRIGNADVQFAAGTGCSLQLPDNMPRIPRRSAIARIDLRRTGSAALTAYVTYFGLRSQGQVEDWRQVTADATIAASDLGKVIRVSSNNLVTLTVPNTLLSQGIRAAKFIVVQEGFGQAKLAAGTSMTFKQQGSKVMTAAQNAMMTVYVCSDNTFWATGDMA